VQSVESQNLRYLLSRGHNLCNDIVDYTYAQVLFMMLAEEKEINDITQQPEDDLTIEGEGDPICTA